MELALELVDTPSHVHMIHVSPSISPTEICYVWETYYERQFLEAAEEALRKWLADAKYQDIEPVVKFGNPGYEIVNHAQDVVAELIVIPSHGRTGLKRVLMGSVAERVVRLADFPVLVLKPSA